MGYTQKSRVNNKHPSERQYTFRLQFIMHKWEVLDPPFEYTRIVSCLIRHLARSLSLAPCIIFVCCVGNSLRFYRWSILLLIQILLNRLPYNTLVRRYLIRKHIVLCNDDYMYHSVCALSPLFCVFAFFSLLQIAT